MPSEMLASAQLDRWHSDFVAALESHQRPRIEEWLERAERSMRTALLIDLLKLELRYRRDAGENPSRAEYAARFPDPQVLDMVFGEAHCVDKTKAPESAGDADTRDPIGKALASTFDAHTRRPSGEPATTVAQGSSGEETPAPEKRFGDYELLEKLGQGGMGVVYKARQMNAGGRLVALKVIRPDKLGNLAEKDRAQALERFRVEARAAAQLQHENLVTVYDVGEVHGQPYYSMQYVEGQSLRSLVQRRPLANRRAAEIMQGVALGIQEAHRHGVLHRDLKPENVLIESESGRPLVADFGLAKLAQERSGMTMTGDIFGTPQYMPPEQARDAGGVTMAGDVYSLGATLYCLITGQPPFSGDLYDLLRRVQEEAPQSPRQLNPAVDADLETLTLRCLEKEPGQRPASAGELAEELARYLRGEPIASRPIGRSERCWRWCKRHPAAAGLLAMSLVACTLAVAGVWLWERSTLAERVAEQRKELVAQKEQLAATHRYYSIVSEARELRTARTPGWTWRTLEKLEAAAALDIEPRNVAELRSLAAEAWSGLDVRPTSFEYDLPSELIDTALAFSPDGERIAFAPRIKRPQCPVHVHDIATGEEVEHYSFNTIGAALAGLFGGGDKVEGVHSLAFSPDGKFLAAGTRQGHIYVWDRQSGQAVRSWQACKRAAELLKFSPDSRLLYLGLPETGGVRRWSVEQDWKEIAGHETPVNSFDLSPDGKWFAYTWGGVNTLHAAELADKEGFPVSEGEHAVAFHPDSRRMVVDFGGAINVVDVRNGAVVQQVVDLDAPDVRLGRYLDFAGESGALLVSAGDDQGVRLWDMAAGKVVARVRGAGAQQFPLAAVNPQATALAVGAAQKVSLHEIHRPELVQTIAYTGKTIAGIDLSADGSRLVCLSEAVQYKESTISLWDTGSGELLRQCHLLGYPAGYLQLRNPRQHQSLEGAVAMSSDGSAAVVATVPAGALLVPFGKPTRARVLQCPGGRNVRVVQESRFAVEGESDAVQLVEDTLASDGRAVRIVEKPEEGGVRVVMHKKDWPVSESNGRFLGWSIFAAVRLEDEDASAQLLRYDYRGAAGDTEKEFDLSLLADQRYHLLQLAVISHDSFHEGEQWEIVFRGSEGESGRAILIDSITAVPVSYTNWAEDIAPAFTGPVAMAPDGRVVWGGVDSEHLVSWKLPELEPRTHWNNSWGTEAWGDSVLWSVAAGQQWVLVGGRDNTLFTISAETGLPVNELALSDTFRTTIFNRQGPGGGITALALSPDERHAMVGTDTGRLRIVEMPTSATVLDLPPRREAVTSLDFDASGRLLAVGSQDGDVALWRFDTRSPELLLTLQSFHGPIQSVRLSADGRKLAVLVEGERAVRFWHLDQLNERLDDLGLAFLTL